MESEQVDNAACRFEQERRRLLEFEKDLHDSQLKRSEGPKLFQCLEEYIVRELGYTREAGKGEFDIACSKPRLLDLLGTSRITVNTRDQKIQALTITYYQSIHQIDFERGEKKRVYKMVVDDDGNLEFETSNHIRMTTEQVGMEMLASIQNG